MHDLEVVIGLDAGTTSAKFVAINRSGAIAASADSDAIPTSAPVPGASVQRPTDIWGAFATACRRGSMRLPKGTVVAATAVAAQSGSVLPKHLDGHTDAITWMDTRSRPLVEAWNAETVRSIRSRSGWMPMAGLGLSTISWLTSTQPSVGFERFASVDDFLLNRLTGMWRTNPSNASGMQLMDVSALEWSSDLCDLADIDRSQLSEIGRSGEPAGTVTDEAAATIGIRRSTPVILGGHDQACAALGLGVISPGDAFLSMGTAWVLTIVVDLPDLDAVPSGFNLSPHVVPGRWTISKNLGGLGAALGTVLPSGGHDDSPSGREITSPEFDSGYFIPEIHHADRTDWGTFTDAAVDDVGRVGSVMEACSFETRRAIDEASSISPVRELIVVGGGTRSEQLLAQIADIVDLSLVARPDASWPAIGAAGLAAHACGWAPTTPPELPSTTVEPDPSAARTSEHRYKEYLRLTSGA